MADSLTLLHEDYHCLVVIKPPNLLSVPGNGPDKQDSVFSRLKAHYPELCSVHRLDCETSGVMVYARGKPAERELYRQFRQRLISKHYQAIVWGHPLQARGRIEAPLATDWSNRPRQRIDFEHGKPSTTEWQYQQSLGDMSLLNLYPITGRSHQLRVHLASLGHGIVGDPWYGDKPGITDQLPNRLYLHACQLGFYHPQTGEHLSFNHPSGFETLLGIAQKQKSPA